VVSRIEVRDLVGERQSPPDPRAALEERSFHLGAVFHDLPAELVTLIELREILLDDLPGVFTIERIRPAHWEVHLDLAACDLVLELRRAPAGAPVELQPILDAEGLCFRVVREDAGMRDR